MITIVLDGRLGNQLFQYVVCRVTAKKLNFDFNIPIEQKELIQNSKGIHLFDYFEVEQGVSYQMPMHIYREDVSLVHSAELYNISDNTLLIGFFQSEKYFIDYESEIKFWLKIKKKTNANFILSRYNPESYCFIHLRGGDYKSLNWSLPISYFKKAIEQIHSFNTNLKFVVITNDPQLAMEYFPNFDYLSNDMMTDFEILKLAKYSIISNSTFSWWAAWLAENQITIAPDYWINYNRAELGTFPKDIKSYKFIHI